MIENLKSTFCPVRFRDVLYLFMLIASYVAVDTTAAQDTNCPPGLTRGMRTANFDNITPPALPPDWMATNAQGPPPLWTTSNSGEPMPPAYTLPNAAFIDDPAVISDKRLDSFPVSCCFESCCLQLTFHHNFNFEASPTDPTVGFDGGVLEVSTDGGNTFQYIPANAFASGGYNRAISPDRGSPIAGLQAWSGNSGGFITTVINLNAPPVTSVRLRWRMASDTSGSGEGWRVDNVIFTWCAGPPGTPKPLPTPRQRPTPAPRPTP